MVKESKEKKRDYLVSNLLFEIFDVIITNYKGRTFRIFDDLFKALDFEGKLTYLLTKLMNLLYIDSSNGFLDLDTLNRKLKELKYDTSFSKEHLGIFTNLSHLGEKFTGRKISYSEFLIS